MKQIWKCLSLSQIKDLIQKWTKTNWKGRTKNLIQINCFRKEKNCFTMEQYMVNSKIPLIIWKDMVLNAFVSKIFSLPSTKSDTLNESKESHESGKSSQAQPSTDYHKYVSQVSKWIWIKLLIPLTNTSKFTSSTSTSKSCQYIIKFTKWNETNHIFFVFVKVQKFKSILQTYTII